MKSKDTIAFSVLALISIYFSALVLWIDPEFSTFKDLLSQGVWIFLLIGSLIWWALLATLFQFVQLRKWTVFLMGTALIAIIISCLIVLLTNTFNLMAFAKLIVVIVTLITMGVLGSWGLSVATDLILKNFPERFHP